MKEQGTSKKKKPNLRANYSRPGANKPRTLCILGGFGFLGFVKTGEKDGEETNKTQHKQMHVLPIKKINFKKKKKEIIERPYLNSNRHERM